MGAVDEARMLEGIRAAYEYSYLHEEWVTPLDELLEGLTAREALRRPANSDKSIWEIVLHVAVWNEDIVIRTRTKEKSRPAEGAWPPAPEEPSEEAWEEAKQRLRTSLNAVDELLRTSTLEELDGGPYGIGDLLCRFTHLGYHLGQISKMR